MRGLVLAVVLAPVVIHERPLPPRRGKPLDIEELRWAPRADPSPLLFPRFERVLPRDWEPEPAPELEI